MTPCAPSLSDRALPHIADWFEAGLLPREIIPELGKLGALGST